MPIGRLAREPGGRQVDLMGARGQAVLREHQRGRAEGVGLDDVAAGFQVAFMNRADELGPGENQILVATFELRAAKVGGRQIAVLDRGAHRAIEDEDAGSERLL